MTRLCFGCKELQEIAYVDAISRGYCSECTMSLPIGSVVRAMGFLSLTIPYKPGDRVQAYTAGELYDGVGTVTDVHYDLKHGGTPVIPMFRVIIDEPADEHAPTSGLYPEACLKRAHELEPAG